MKKVNLALQVLPTAGPHHDSYALVDAAINIIAQSGLKYKVCPFETVIEGTYAEVMEVVEKAQDACFAAGAEKMMVYIKIQRDKNRDAQIEDKLNKYE
ncbi:MAG: thiamine-binding protein [Cyclobacteriaceae bacterium]